MGDLFEEVFSNADIKSYSLRKKRYIHRVLNAYNKN